MIRRTAAVLLVDVQLAIRSGAWIPSRTFSPFAAMERLEAVLASPASDDTVSDAVDALYAAMGLAMMAGEAVMPGYEQFELADVAPTLLVEETPVVAVPANDTAPLRRAA